MAASTFGESSTAGAPSANDRKLAISVFGGIGIGFAGEELRLANRKARALVAYLALSDTGPEPRERLAGLLWPDTSEQNARASLRQVLRELTGIFTAYDFNGFVAGRVDLKLLGDAFDVDISIALRDIDEGRTPEILLVRPRAAETILAGYDDVSPLYQEWIVGIRARMQERLVRGLQRGHENDALPRRQRRLMAEALLMLDPLHEGACRTAMQLAAEDGEIGAALRAYANLYEALGEELDMEPSAPTLELVADIKRGRFDRNLGEGAPRPSLGGTGLEPRARSSSGAPVVAVLPFRIIGPNAEPGYFAEGVLDDTVRTLAMLREPVVISSNSTREFRGAEVDFRQVGQRVGAQYIVSGTVRSVGPRLRLSAELVEVNGGTVLWSRAYDAHEPLELDAQDDIATNIARTLVPHLRTEELRRSRGQQPEDLNAYRLMLRARELIFSLEQATFEQAGEFLREAIRRDPGYAPLHTITANWYSLRIGQGWSPEPESDVRALETSARTAITLDPAAGRAMAMLAHNRTILRREFDDALSLLDRALDVAPNDAEALMWSGPTYAYGGRAAEAVHRLERAIALSPEDPFMFRFEHFLSIAHYADGNFEEAAHWGTRSMRRNPHYLSNLRMTAASLAGAGRAADARPLVQMAMQLQPEFRVGALVANHSFRDTAKLELYAGHLTGAGLPP